MKERALFLIAGVLLPLVVLICLALALKQSPLLNTIADVSWPNCKIHPPSYYRLGLIGVTGGLDFHPNPCLAQETSWFNHYALYMNTGYAGPNVRRNFQVSPRRCAPNSAACKAYNYGYNAARYALNYAASQNAHAGLWWLDVETENSWTASASVNRAELMGSLAAIRQSFVLVQIGFYSYPSQWNLLTGHWHNWLPAWVATGSPKLQAAAAACRAPAFNDGTPWLGQYTLALDQNVACSPNFTRTIYENSSLYKE